MTETKFFKSVRERRLWIWTLLVLAAILSTLGLGSVLASIRVPQSVAAVFFVLGMLLVAVTVLTQGLRTRPGGFEVGIAIGISAVYLMFFLRLTIPERSHLIEFGVLSVFIYEALKERKGSGGRVPLPFLLAIVIASLVGVIDESAQIFIPDRVFDPVDILFNFLASTMAVSSVALLNWARSLRSGSETQS
ncbi:MAG: VanZ family protein [Acidobacteria bacterium]|nr:MAG: VanZ family protein [Acidobacteriota bacterium]REK01997.1 MAG: VanZ family protein [Acidobacteriota bacterium]REK14955.1 MAG: VanZ family protein [Acidobacteriota bacterium]REK45669.1 MAG: VanZ family protein [Acidobacteriota bacterium]